mgnify:CR=1
MSGTSHDHDQPAHLRVKEHLKHVPSGELSVYSVFVGFIVGFGTVVFVLLVAFVMTDLVFQFSHADISIKKFAGPEQRFCPAGKWFIFHIVSCVLYVQYVSV